MSASRSGRPEQLGDYRILREVGRGGMGVVYEAVQESLGRHVALKVLPAQALLDPQRLARFRREAQAAARLHHTNIVPVFGVGEADGCAYYVMQFIRGRGLDQVLEELKKLRREKATPAAAPPVSAEARGLLTGRFTLAEGAAEGGSPAEKAPDSAPTAPLSGQSETTGLSEAGRGYWQSVARVGAQVAEALAYANAQGVLHRDVKPSNLLLDGAGTVWVTDFGLAKVHDAEGLTHTGDVVGTLRYMAPERFDGRADARSDLYALGLTLYELLTLRPAFDERERNKLIAQVMHAEPPRPAKVNPAVPRDLETVVLKAIARDPARRYQAAQELADDLRRFVDDRPIQARRVSRLEHAWRWSRRNPVIAGLSAALLLVLLTGAPVIVWKWLQAERAQQDEKSARADAEDKGAKAAAAAAELQDAADRLHRANGFMESGRLHESQGEWKKALADYSEAVGLRPDHAEVWASRGRFYLQLGLLDRAADDIDKAFEVHEPSDFALWYYRACLHLNADDPDGYRRLCARMLERFGDATDPTTGRWVVRVCTLGPDAVADLGRVERIAENTARAAGDADAAALLGAAHCRAGRVEMGGATAWYAFQAIAAFHAGKADMAREILAQGTPLVGYAGGDARDRARRQTLHLSNLAGTFADLPVGAALRAKPDADAPPHEPDLLANWLGDFLVDREAHRLIDRPAPTDHPLPWVVRAHAFACLGQWGEAHAALDEAMQARPDALFSRMNARLFVAEGRPDDAIDAYTQSLELDGFVKQGGQVKAAGFDPVPALQERSALYAEQKQWDKAAADLGDAASRSGHDFTLVQARGRIFSRAGEWDKAAADYAAAVRILVRTPPDRPLGPGFGGWPGLPMMQMDLPRDNAKAASLFDEIASSDEIYPRVMKDTTGFEHFHVELLRRRVHHLAGQRRWDDAADMWCSAFVNPDAGNTSLSTMQEEAAAWDELFARVTRRRPKDAGLWAARAKRLAREGREDEAAAALVEELDHISRTDQDGKLPLYWEGQIPETVVARAAALRPDDVRPWMELGRLRVNRIPAKPDEAAAAFDKALALQPADAGLRLAAIGVLRDRGYADRTTDYLDQYLRLQPKDYGAWLQLARARGVQGRWDQALDAYDAALQVRPGNAFLDVYSDLCGSVAPDKADVVFRKLAERRPHDADLWLRRGDGLAGRSQMSRAVDSYTEAIRRDPDNRQALQQRGRAHIQLQQWDEAADDFAALLERAEKDAHTEAYLQFPTNDPLFHPEVFRRLTARRPKDAWPWALRARSFIGQRLYDEAAADYAKAVEVQPNEPILWYERGLLFAMRGDLDRGATFDAKALELLPDAPPYPPEHEWIHRRLASDPAPRFNAVAALRPKDPWLWAARARQSPSLTAAEADFAKALDLRPREAGLWYSRAWAYGDWGKWDKAAADYAAGLKLREPDDTMGWLALISARAAAGDRDGVRAAGERMFALYGATEDPGDAHRTALCCLLLPDAFDDPKTCLRLAEKAYASDPASPWNVYTLALAQYRTGQYDRVVPLVKKYLESNPQCLEEHLHVLRLLLGMAEHRLGHDEEARKWVGEAARRIDEVFPPQNGRVANQKLNWWIAWANCQVLRAEAEAALKEPAPRPDK
jgi:serine/threonine protein kinase/predicted Zn-dependent protease